MTSRATALLWLGLCLSMGAAVRAQDAPPPPLFPSSPPPRIPAVPLTPLSAVPGAKPWTAQLKTGWNLLSFPGVPEGELTGLHYALVDTTTNQPISGKPSSWQAYWAYADSDTLVSAPLGPASSPSALHLREGWNAIASPLNHPEGLGSIAEGEAYGQAYTGALGHFHAQPFGSGFSLPPGQVVWVYAYKPAQVGLQSAGAILGSTLASTAIPRGVSVPSGTNVSPQTVQGQVVDKRGHAIEAKITLQGPFGHITTLSDGAGRFSATLPPGSTQGTISLRVSAPYHEALRQNVTMPLQRPISVVLPNQLATLWFSAYSYKWGKSDYRPYSVVIYEYGDYHSRRTSWFPHFGTGRTDTSVKYFPQGRPYRMVVTWYDRRGNQQTLVRDGTVTSSYQTFYLWNSWTYN